MTATHATECANCPYLAGEHLPPNGQCPGTSGLLPTRFKARRPGKVIDLLDRLAPRVEPEPPTLTIVEVGDRVQTTEGPGIAVPFQEANAIPLPLVTAPPVEPKPKRTRAQFCECRHARTLHPSDGVCAAVDPDGRGCRCSKFERKKRAKKTVSTLDGWSRIITGQTGGSPGAEPADPAETSAPPQPPLSLLPAPVASSISEPSVEAGAGLPQDGPSYAYRFGRLVGATEVVEAALAAFVREVETHWTLGLVAERALDHLKAAVKRAGEVAR